VESHDRVDTPPPPDEPLPSKPTPPIPPRADSAETGEDDDDDADADANNDEPTGRKDDDPYSNLGGAFGTYMADEPQPMGAGGRQGDDEDLLF